MRDKSGSRANRHRNGAVGAGGSISPVAAVSRIGHRSGSSRFGLTKGTQQGRRQVAQAGRRGAGRTRERRSTAASSRRLHSQDHLHR